MSDGSFRSLAPALWRSGLGEPFPLHAGSKKPIERGVHGRTDPTITKERVKAWMRKHPDAIPGLIPAEGILILDVDEHDDKHGARNLARALGLKTKADLRRLLHGSGTLHVSGRPDASEFHGHWYFEVPPDFKWAKRYPVPGCEVIGPGRRGFYVVAPGAVHAETGKVYRCEVAGRPWEVADLTPEVVQLLPDALTALLAGEEPKDRTQGQGEVWEALELMPEGEPDAEVRAVLEAFEADPEQHGTAHATVLQVQLALVNLGERGHAGVKAALDRVRDVYEALRPERVGEFDRYLEGVSVDLARVRRGNETGDWSRGGKPSLIPKAAMLALKDEFTDVAIARRAVKDFAERNHPVKWNEGLGYLGWDGRRWRSMSPELVKKNLIRFFTQWVAEEDAAHVGDQSGDWDTRRGQLRSLLSTRKVNAVAALLPGECHCDSGFFDQHHDLLNCVNGVVDLRTGEVGPHDPALGFTKVTRVPYVPGVRDERWDQIKAALPEDEAEYLLYRLGQAATGYIPSDDKVCFLVGGGENGKSTFMTPIVRAFGDFAVTVRQELLIGERSQHPEVKMDLFGARLAFLDETAEAYLNPHRLKDIIGNMTLSGRYLYKSVVRWTPTHSLIVNTNYPPKVTETDRGTWRRLEQIHFAKTFGKTDRPVLGLREAAATDRALWIAALSDVIEHAIQVMQWKNVLPAPPAGVVAATNAWRDENDTLSSFVNERLEVAPGYAVPVRDLAAEFNKWQGEGNRPVTMQTVKQRFEHSETLPEGFTYTALRISANMYQLSQSLYMAKLDEKWRGIAWVGVKFKD
jgi:putative DNA primase/helicase